MHFSRRVPVSNFKTGSGRGENTGLSLFFHESGYDSLDETANPDKQKREVNHAQKRE
jgi:hypothetical protein